MQLCGILLCIRLQQINVNLKHDFKSIASVYCMSDCVMMSKRVQYSLLSSLTCESAPMI